MLGTVIKENSRHVTNFAKKFRIRNHLIDNFAREIRHDVLVGLTDHPKHLPCKYFYDARGSELFERICDLPEYYQTRTEIGIIKNISQSIVPTFKDCDIIELGSGSARKIRLFFDAMDPFNRRRVRYIPVDVSLDAINAAGRHLNELYPDLDISGVGADFTSQMACIPNGNCRVVIFFGSTIGNFSKSQTLNFFSDLSSFLNKGDRLLIGLDMVKSKKILEAAYNDSKGLTAQFNRNILYVINRELTANFVPDSFEHLAFFNESQQQVEMYLKAGRDMKVSIGELGITVDFKNGEMMMTEICRKFTREEMVEFVVDFGFEILNWHCDEKKYFSLVEMVKAS